MTNTKIILKPLILLFFLTGLIFVSFFGCSLFSKKYEKKEVTEYKINVTGKKLFSVDNINGNIKISRNTTDSLLRIKAELYAYVSKKELNEPLDRIKIKIDSSGNEVSLNSEYYREKRFFHLDIGKSDKINYEISVPANLEISIDNTSGKVDIRDIDNDIKLNIINGDVSLINTTGNLNADLTNSKIRCELDSTKGLNIKNVNENITLYLGNAFSGNIKAECVNGKIVTKDLDFKKSDNSKNSFEGKLGNSDVDVRLETVNGKIFLNKK